jgi:hypothetical protein
MHDRLRRRVVLRLPSCLFSALQRRSLERENDIVLTSWGHGGCMAGQFKWVHNIGVDFKGNLYTGINADLTIRVSSLE